MQQPGPLDFTVGIEDFDHNVLPEHVRRAGGEQLEQAIITYYQRQFAAVGGTVELDMDEERIHVTWRPDEASRNPFEYALSLLQSGELEQAIPLLETMLAAEPGEPTVLYNLGMAYSDTGRIDRAVSLLSHAVEADPQDANSLVALGIARQRNEEYSESLGALRSAIALDPSNSYAHRNLGGILASLGGIEEAQPHLREAVRLAPNDQQAVYGLAATLEKLGGDERVREADELYKSTIELNPSSQIAELARTARSKMAQESFRQADTGPRMDAVMYCLDALKKFDAMTPEQVQSVTLEIALKGRQGLETNDSAQQYKLDSLDGNFSGLHLVSLMYVGFKHIAPDQDMGFDLSQEYEAAREMFSQEKG